MTIKQLEEAGQGWDFQQYFKTGRTSCWLCHKIGEVKFYFYEHTYPIKANPPAYLLVTWCGCPPEYGKIIEELTSKDIFALKVLGVV